MAAKSLDRAAYPSDVSAEEWARVAPYLALLRESSGQRDHDLREVFDGLRYIVKTGAPWRFMPHDLPPWAAAYQQTQRWLAAECFAEVAGDLRAALRMAGDREPEPSAVILNSRTLRSSPESGERAGYDGATRKKGSKVHLAVDTSGHMVALQVTPADAGDRGEVGRLAAEVQAETDASVETGFVDQGYTGDRAAEAAKAPGITLEVVKAPEAKRGFVLLPRRWGMERSFAWATRCRRLVKDYEGYATTRAGSHMVAFVCLMLRQVEKLMISS
ncbi:IS5 family transposase [Methylobacterium trifolii]|uniref:IS5 family transposase ISMtsp14 n=1 Tax=Methylobacterium trifolii TaxID=1003092 RepID=A0ABQ4U3J6_9HYPH|nr:IS5 family transposase [Methylobacterium trifolii]GJE61429.1 IS5 family transposase ISMtsp14 [Methylobacterium trifolii]